MQASQQEAISGQRGRPRRCLPASGCASFLYNSLTARACSPAIDACLLVQGIAPAKAAAEAAQAVAKKKAADEEAAGEDDSKFDEFMVGLCPCALPFLAPSVLAALTSSTLAGQ